MQKCKELVAFIQSIYNTKEFIALHEPKFFGNEKKYLNECIDSTFVSSVGKFVDKLEIDFAKYVGAKFAVALINGTSALHLALRLVDVGKGDEVITQALSFVATSNAIKYCGAEPIFLDVERDTMGLSPNAVRDFLEKNCQLINHKCINKTTNRTIKAVVPMHTFGHPCNIEEIQQICKEWHIALVEDSAESLGSFYKKKHTGTFGELGVFSFNGNKIITSGGGGMIVTQSEVLAKRAKHLSTTAKIDHPFEYEHDALAYNYRMPNINAALLVAQLENLEKLLKSKKILAHRYAEFFKNDDIKLMKQSKNTTPNHWLNAIVLKNREQRDSYLECLNENGVMTRPIWKLLNQLPMYKESQSDSLVNSLYFQDRVINLPSSAI